MSLLDTYRQKLEIQIQEHKAHLDLLKARARQVAAQSKIELAQADKHLNQAKARFVQLKGAGGGALKEIRSGLNRALADLKVSTKKAARHFNHHPLAAKPKSAKRRAPAKPARPAKKQKR